MTGPFPAIFDKDGKYLGDLAPSRDVYEFMQEYASKQVRRRFTEWLTDPDNEGPVIERLRRYRAKETTDGGIRFYRDSPAPPLFLLPGNMITP